MRELGPLAKIKGEYALDRAGKFLKEVKRHGPGKRRVGGHNYNDFFQGGTGSKSGRIKSYAEGQELLSWGLSGGRISIIVHRPGKFRF